MGFPPVTISRRRTAPVVAGVTVLVLIALGAAPATQISRALAATPSPGIVASPSGFVHRSGATLTLNAAPWRFVGFNDYQLTSLPGGAFSCGRQIDQPTLDSILQDARNAGATVIRTWFFQSYYDQNAAGQTISPTWAAFNRVLSSAAAHGLKVIPVLVNEWPDCEPASSNKGLGFYQTGYKSAGYGYALSFKAYAATVAAHYAGPDDRLLADRQRAREQHDGRLRRADRGRRGARAAGFRR
jgi:hypothetical protein